MTLVELKTGIISLMKKKYPTPTYKYYSKMVVESYDRPSFFLRLAPIQNSRETTTFRSKQFALYITYFQPILDEVDILTKIDEIERLFGNYVRIGDRAIDVTGFDFDYLGNDRNILEITVDLEWMDRINTTETADPMESVSITQKLEG